ncbi:hypothetical protein BMETH_1407_0 [methanotrophic bacterial endosymbiont of Bathymodiolus sp.]|nr:hypothetical protein BMETH_1407_0 [methanotrophic bacterial endosymbiont of Bathymodiolus sp.]
MKTGKEEGIISKIHLDLRQNLIQRDTTPTLIPKI